MNSHRFNINQLKKKNYIDPNRDDLNLANHFAKKDHSNNCIELYILEKGNFDTKTRKLKESYYIGKYNTIKNGLNKNSGSIKTRFFK